MCGICGFVGNGVAAGEASIGAAMRETLVHRGPDGEGELILTRADGNPAGWFGHRRLKIIDLTDAAHQPMASDDGLVVLNYNGEVYNFRELRRKLEAAGRRFRSTGDTEVVLRAYEEWGEGFVERLEGMFALAVWDGRCERLLLARDRAGKKPLYYAYEGGRLTFASEIKALLRAPWVTVRPAPARLPEYLTYGYVPHPHTFYDGISQVPPASTVVFDAGGLHRPTTYWDPLRGSEPAGVDSETPPAIARLLADATRRRLVADVPLGALLSGGVDSSIVVGLMTQASAEPVWTFTIAFPDEPSYDESAYAALVARHFGTRHVEFPVSIDAIALLDTLLWHHDQPYADSSALPTYLVCRLAREHVTVALNGDGGDEVFGGYDRFKAVALADRVPAPVAGLARGAARLLPRSDAYYSIRRRAERFGELASSSPEHRYQSWISVFGQDALARVLRPELAAAGETVRESMTAWYERSASRAVLDRIVYANFKTYLPDDLAVKMDRMSMASSLETRSPFLDAAVVEHVMNIVASRRVGLRTVKPLLRAAFGPLLPDAIWKRRKHGFGVPVGRWFRGELGTLFEDEVLAADARSRDFIEPSAVRALWDEHQTGVTSHGPRLWTLLTLERWLRYLERVDSWGPPTAREPVSA